MKMIRRDREKRIYDITFLGTDCESVDRESSDKVLFPLRNDTPIELQCMEYADKLGLDPLAYRARLLRPEEARKAIQQDRRKRVVASVGGQLLEQLSIKTVDDFLVVNKLQERAVH